MQIMDILQTGSALASLLLIVIGCLQLKSHLKRHYC